MPNKLIVILGPTASGKSALAVKLARLFNGEVISADSRQVYKGLDVGSGKITKKEMQGIPHYLLDVASPRRRFTVAQYQKLALRAIAQIQRRGKIPFLVGGTGFYIQSIVDSTVFPEVPPNRALRARLAKKSVAELFAVLKKLDPARAATIDTKNPHRLIRAIEIVTATGRPVPKVGRGPTSTHFDTVQIGITKSPVELKKAIAKRLKKRIKKIIAEVKKLHANGLSWRRLEELGLEYRYTAQYLQYKTRAPKDLGARPSTQQELSALVQKESERFAKRQMTWFKRDKRIYWITNQKEAEKLVKNFL